MKFTFTEKKMDSSEDLRAYATKKISKLDRLFKSEGEAFVTFSVERGRYRAEITINNNGMYYRANELTNDMCASIDSGVAAIERQIRKNKTKLAKRIREGALERTVEDTSYIPVEDDEEDSQEEFQIVRSKKFSIKPMTVQEAILQMNLLGHEFLCSGMRKTMIPSRWCIPARTADTVSFPTPTINCKYQRIPIYGDPFL